MSRLQYDRYGGPEVMRLRAGDALLGGARFRQAGAFAEMVVAPEKAVVLKPVWA